VALELDIKAAMTQDSEAATAEFIGHGASSQCGRLSKRMSGNVPTSCYEGSGTLARFVSSSLKRKVLKNMLNCHHRSRRSICGSLWLALACSQLWAETGDLPTIRVFKVSDGVPFAMGKVDSRRILHPEMGAKKLTLNYAVSQPGHEFPQHVHDYSDDTFLVLQGQVDVRQGDSRRPLATGQAAFVPSGQIHGTITTGTGTAILISFQGPPDMVLYSGARDSSRPGAAPPKGVITPGAVKLLDFSNQNGFFVHPGMGSKGVAVAHRKLKPGEKFSTDVADDGEQLLFIWKGTLSVKSTQAVYEASERETVFVSGRNKLEVQNSSSNQAIVVQVQAPPAFWMEVGNVARLKNGPFSAEIALDRGFHFFAWCS
jgi:mannose-6-phosphate isomerase-like protein (cupin superfamily)